MKALLFLAALAAATWPSFAHAQPFQPQPAGARWVKMVSPVSGQRFTAPATLRVFAAAFNPSGTACGADGSADRCADRVDFLVDDVVAASVPKGQSEYWVFKGTITGVAAGTHRIRARAIYTNPAATLESDEMTVTIDPAPAYAQTVTLTQDMVLSGAQNYELVGAAGARIRLNGNGRKITSTSNWTGRLTLRHVDLFDLGVIDVATSNTATVEDCVFDSTDSLSLYLTGAATASIRRNDFRSNMRMQESQQPEFGSDASYPAVRISGNSTAAKVFQANSIGIGWADFRNADNWLIGGAGADGNVVIAPRGGIWAQNMARTTIRGNLVYHLYYGGWSQGNVMELSGSEGIVVEGNVIGGGSWPIRSLDGGILRNNVVLDAGHQWLWITGDDASVHNNIFVGGDGDVAGIYVLGNPQGVEILNNTIDAGGRAGFRPVWVTAGSSASFNGNAVANVRDGPAIRIDGTLAADRNLFHGQVGTPKNYSDNRKPPNDAGALNAQVDPKFAQAGQPARTDWAPLWTRAVKVDQLLAQYRAHYAPAAGSPLLAGIGAVGTVADIFNNARLFAQQQYRDFLGREGDAAGVTHWASQIDAGAQTRAQMVETFFNSAEFQGLGAPVVRLYFAYLLRIPDYNGLNFWIGQFRGGQPLVSISNAFAQSPEFVNRYGTLNNAQFVDRVYQNVLGRAPDADGLAHWTGQLNAGMTRGQLMVAFSESPEYRAVIANEVYVTMMYAGMLRRAPDATGFSHWLGYMDAGNSGLALIQGFLDSIEYHGRF